MTPQQPQQEQEYLITRSRAREISIRYNFPSLVEQMVDEVCSRPSPAAPSCFGIKWVGHQPCNACDCYRDCGDEYSKYMKKHDATIAAKARKDVLKELRNHLTTRKVSFETHYPKGHDQRDGAQTRIAEIDQTLMALDAIESLRSSTPSTKEAER